MRQCLLTLLRGSHKKYKCKSSVRKICINWAESDLRLWTQLITLKKHFVSWAASFNSFLDKGGILLPALRWPYFQLNHRIRLNLKHFNVFSLLLKLDLWLSSLIHEHIPCLIYEHVPAFRTISVSIVIYHSKK